MILFDNSSPCAFRSVVIVMVDNVHCRLARVIQQSTPNCPHEAARMDLTPNKQQVPFKHVSRIFVLLYLKLFNCYQPPPTGALISRFVKCPLNRFLRGACYE